jgi:hypothetical protein
MIPSRDDTISEIKPFDRILADAKAEVKTSGFEPKLKELCEDALVDWTGGIEC